MDLNEKYKDYVFIDEAGRGNLAGFCVFCGLVLLSDPHELSFAIDSKKTTKQQRAKWASIIKSKSESIIIKIPAEKIDQIGLSKCISGALEEIKLHFPNKQFLYDGNKTFGVSGIETLVKADALVTGVSCASILAKEQIDLSMEEFDKLYPEYGFCTNAGYGTKKHIEAIKEYGYTPIHRKSYKIKELEKSSEPNILF